MTSSCFESDIAPQQGEIEDPKGTVASVILASDKTQLSVFSGDKAAWPVYITIGNLAKHARRQPSRKGTLVLMYLPVVKLACIKSSSRRRERLWELFHYMMTVCLEPLVHTGRHGQMIACADGLVRKVFPIIMAYIADFPEQCTIASCVQSGCPVCYQGLGGRSTLWQEPATRIRCPNTALRALRIKEQIGTNVLVDSEAIRPTWPFWARLPLMSIYLCIAPDQLHQLLKGLFKDHLSKWFLKLLGREYIDSRYKCMTPHHGLRHFKSGITGVSQWTGKEILEMMKVFLCVVSDSINTQGLEAARALMDFIYLAHFSNIRESQLSRMEMAISIWEDNKAFFIDNCNIDMDLAPKLHMIFHYVHFARLLGSSDGTNTESPERHHKESKKAYGQSNKDEATEQMTIYLQRHESITSWNASMDRQKEVWSDSDSDSDLDSNSDPDLLLSSVLEMEQPAQAALRCAHSLRPPPFLRKKGRSHSLSKSQLATL